MALIKCPECQKEISDKAAACIYCGCPIEAAFQNNSTPRVLYLSFNAHVHNKADGKATQKVFVKELNRDVEFDINNSTKVGEKIKINLMEGGGYDYIIFTAASVSQIPEAVNSSSVNNATTTNNKERENAISMIGYYKPNFLVKFFNSRIIIKLISMSIVFIVAGRFGDIDIDVLIPIIAAIVLFFVLGSFVPIWSVKGYFRKYGIDDAIKNDTGYMNVAISAYNALPCKKMLKYIKSLNIAAGLRIAQQLAAKKK